MSARRQIVFEPFRLDPVNACLWRGTQVIHLTPKAYAALCFLTEHAGRLVTKRELLDAVWPDTIVGEASLPVCVREIRRALRDRPSAPRFIETVHCRGYRFVAPTTAIERPDAEVYHPATTGGRQVPARSPVPFGLVGRDRELRALKSCLEKALAGDRQVILVAGEVGIGKTALVESFCGTLEEGPGLWIASGECFEHHGPREAFMPVLVALQRLCRAPGGDRAAAILRRRAPTWMAPLHGLQGTAGWELAPQEILGATPERMLRECAEAIEILTADAPLVLVLEDLHWSDYSTLDLVSALARRRDPARLLLLATYRPVEVIVTDHPLHTVKQELLTHRSCEELTLELLTEEAVAEYLALRFPASPLPGALARLVHERTDGNPFFMIHVIDDLLARGVVARRGDEWELREGVPAVPIRVPEGVRPTIERQLTRLGPHEQRMLEGASVAGMEFSAAAVAAVVGEDVVAVEESCERLVQRRQFLRAAGVSEWPDGTLAGRYGFLHWLYQDLLYRRVTAARRRGLHERLGQRMEAAHGTSKGEVASELARHFEQAGDLPRAIHYLLDAAQNVCRRHAHREALDSLQRALDLVERLPDADRAASRAAVLERRGLLRRDIGDMPGAVVDFTALAESARAHGDVEVKALLYLASVLFWIDRARCLEVADRSVMLGRQIANPLLQAHARGQRAHWRLQVLGWQDEELRAFATAAKLVRQGDDRALHGLYVTLEAYYAWLRSEYRAATIAADEGKQLTSEMNDSYHYMSCHYFRACALLHLGELGEGLRAARHGLEMAEKNGHLLATRVFRFTLSWFHEQVFDFEQARALCEPLILHTLGGQFDLYLGLIRLGMAHLGRRDLDSAYDCFRAVTDRLDRGDRMDWIWYMHLHNGLAEYWLARGDLAGARREAEKTRTLAEQSGERTYGALGRRLLAEVAIARRDWDRAETELSGALGLLEGDELPLARWRLDATAARLHQKRRRPAAAKRCRGHSRAVLHRLADSLDADDPLRQHMLSHLPI
jgi:DNA-binding winged helix-turn-helix (wHTH) protein